MILRQVLGTHMLLSLRKAKMATEQPDKQKNAPTAEQLRHSKMRIEASQAEQWKAMQMSMLQNQQQHMQMQQQSLAWTPQLAQWYAGQHAHLQNEQQMQAFAQRQWQPGDLQGVYQGPGS